MTEKTWQEKLYGSDDIPTSEEKKEARFEQAQREFEELVTQVQSGEKNTHDVAMWIQEEGYRLRHLSDAHDLWNRLA